MVLDWVPGTGSKLGLGSSLGFRRILQIQQVSKLGSEGLLEATEQIEDRLRLTEPEIHV